MLQAKFNLNRRLTAPLSLINILLSIPKKKKGGCFLNNLLTEVAIGLQFSPFDRGEHSASFYIWLKNPVCKCDE
jgi:hypothetical protein